MVPKISIILPTYNRTSFIGRAIKSVLNQTYQDFELIIVDDGSTDDTENMVKFFSDERIHYLKHEINQGAAVARNTGINDSKGEYIAFIDSDDEWLPEKLEKQINKFYELPKDFGLVYCGHYACSQKTGKILFEKTPHFRGDVHEKHFEGGIAGMQTPLIRRECFQKCGLFDEKLHSWQDWDMWFRISKYYKFDFVSDLLVIQYFHENQQITSNLKAKILGKERLVKKYRVELSEHPSTLSEYLVKLGVLYSLDGNFKKAREKICKSIKLKPFRLKNYIHYFLLSIVPNLYHKLVKNRYIVSIDGTDFF